MKSSLQRGLSILDLFSEEKLEWSSEEIVQALGLSRPTVYRYLKTLSEFGLLTSPQPNVYTCGPMVAELDYMLQRSDSLLLAGTSSVNQLARQFGGTAMLMRWYQHKILCIYACSSQPGLSTSYVRGRPMPLGRGAISHSIMASLSRRQAMPLIQQYLPDLQELGLGNTAEEVYTQLKALRRRGAFVAHEEVTPGVVGTSAAILIGPNRPVGAVSITVNAHDHTAQSLETIAASVRDVAREIHHQLAQRA